VGAYVFLAKGVGASLTAWAWPVLFIGLGWNFLEAGIFGGDPVGWICGVLFVVMGAVPLILTLRAPGGPRSLIVGTVTLRGETVGAHSHIVSQVQSGFARPSWEREEDAPAFAAVDYLVLVLLWLVEALVGVWLGLLLLGF
jgi:hypothetical protein